MQAEAAAVGAYSRLLRDARSRAVTETLRRLLEDHRQALALLGCLSPSGGAVPPQASERVPSSSPWASALTSERDAASLVEGLERAEGEALSVYEGAAKDPHLPPTERVALLMVILPRQRSHSAMLARLRGSDAGSPGS